MVLTVILIIFVAVPAIVLHEVAHGWVASRLGDDTARRMGRLTLNPIKHVDPIGTVAVPAALYLIYALGWTHSLVMFGWAKPVPVNFNRLGHPRRDMLLVALAGPVTNILIAFVLAQILRFALLPYAFSEILFYAILLNLTLAIFNLLPIPPLDGSRVVSSFLPDDLERKYSTLEPYGMLILVILMNLGWLGFLHYLIYGAMRLMGL
jgi:Zn-dependent protease